MAQFLVKQGGLPLDAAPEDPGARRYENLPAPVREELRNFAALELIPGRHAEAGDLLRDDQEARLAAVRTGPPKAAQFLPVQWPPSLTASTRRPSSLRTSYSHAAGGGRARPGASRPKPAGGGPHARRAR
jgi:hypothetical protein